MNACGESARSAEDASKTPPPASTGGSVAGVASGNSEIYYGENALFGGHDWFQTLTGWFPQNLGSSGSISPNKQVVDMAYSADGTMTFNNVVVPTSGLYTIEWRYAFQGGLFPSVNNRQMGVAVNGSVITTTERFPITGSFDVYQDSSLQAHLNAGRNSVTLFAVSRPRRLPGRPADRDPRDGLGPERADQPDRHAEQHGRDAELDCQHERQPDLVQHLPRHRHGRRGRHAGRHRERHDHDVHRHRPDQREDVLLQRRRQQQRGRVTGLERGLREPGLHHHRPAGADRALGEPSR